MKRPELLIKNGELSGRVFSVKDGGLRLGRSSSNDIPVPDEELSRNHCLFEAVGESGIRVTDLASANGTYVNGKALGVDPADLKPGDLIGVGTTLVKVIGDGETTPAAIAGHIIPGQVDLGLGAGNDALPVSGRRRSPFMNILWLVTVLLAVAAIFLVLKKQPAVQDPVPLAVAEEKPVLKEACYEKVEADSNGIFRYEMVLSADGVLSVAADDVPKENRHLKKSQPLDAKALAELGEILSWNALRDLDREYAGVEPDPPALNSWSLKVMYSTRMRSVRIANTQEPEAFRAVREKLEAFSKNQLGIWAIQYSRDKLITLAVESLELGKSKWNDRDVQHGNLFGAVAAYQEAIFYLETVNPKPDCNAEARSGLEKAAKELDMRYKDQRFLADRAINLGQWDVARRELQILMEMIPDRNDERNREAATKLIDVEKRMNGGK